MNKIKLPVFAGSIFLLFLAWGPLVGSLQEVSFGTVDQLPSYLISKGSFAIMMLVLMAQYGTWRFFGLHAGHSWRFLVPSLPILVLTVLAMVNPEAAYSLSAAATVGWVSVTLAVGIGEEAVFRGILWRALGDHSLAFRAFVTSALFGGAHLMGLFTDLPWQIIVSQAVFAFGMGMVFAAIRVVSGSLIAPIALHTIFDAGVIVAAGGVNEMLGEALNPLQLLIPGVFFLAWGTGCLWFINRRRTQEHSATAQ